MTEEPQVRRTSDVLSDVAQAYDRWSRRYDDDHNATRDLEARVVRQSPLRANGARVIELGCGTGKNSEWLAAQARELVALDFSPGMLDVARRRVRAAHVRFVEHDITRSGRSSQPRWTSSWAISYWSTCATSAQSTPKRRGCSA